MIRLSQSQPEVGQKCKRVGKIEANQVFFDHARFRGLRTGLDHGQAVGVVGAGAETFHPARVRLPGGCEPVEKGVAAKADLAPARLPGTFLGKGQGPGVGCFAAIARQNPGVQLSGKAEGDILGGEFELFKAGEGDQVATLKGLLEKLFDRFGHDAVQTSRHLAINPPAARFSPVSGQMTVFVVQ